MTTAESAFITAPALTDRQQREASFYDRYADVQRVDVVDFAPVLSAERKPWNPYWYACDIARKHFTQPDMRALDVGCGIGIAALRLAKLGYQTAGFDISSRSIAIAEQLADRHDLRGRCQFVVGSAELFDYEDASFDLVFGIDVLHHVSIDAALAETRRVLRPGGLAIFKEPVSSPLDTFRDSRLGQRLAPAGTSFDPDHHVTDDERKINAADRASIHAAFDRTTEQRFGFIGRLHRLIPRCPPATRGILQRFDRCLLHRFSPLRRLGDTVVFVCQSLG